jgi:hypothetical protein
LSERTTVFVCFACGKRSRDRYGDQPISGGWDESCMLNSGECYEDSLTINASGRVMAVLPDGLIPEPPPPPRTAEQEASSRAALLAYAQELIDARDARGAVCAPPVAEALKPDDQDHPGSGGTEQGDKP